jgi:hypothetical protein
MPDEDRFERLLRGRGWKRSYRLACGGSPIVVLADSIIKASASALRGHGQCPSLQRIADVLSEALELAPRGSGFAHLADALDLIEAEDIGFVGTQVARKAAEKVFLERAGRSDGGREIVDQLGETFICDLIDHQLLSRVRPSVTEKNHRSVEDQHRWEGELRDVLKPLACKLFRSALKSEDKNAIRAPKRTAAPPPPLEIRLHEPLIPLQR